MYLFCHIFNNFILIVRIIVVQNVSFKLLMPTEWYTCGKVLQDKLPLTNPLLQSLGAIQPETRGHSKTLSYIQKLPTYATTVLNEAETEEYDQEIRKFHIDNSIPEIEDTRIDHWW